MSLTTANLFFSAVLYTTQYLYIKVKVFLHSYCQYGSDAIGSGFGEVDIDSELLRVSKIVPIWLCFAVICHKLYCP